MTATYHPWGHDARDDSLAWTKDRPAEISEKKYLLNEAVPCADWFPLDLAFKLAPNKGVKLADAIPNTLHLAFVSSKLKGILEKHSGTNIEFLPVRIRDHKGRIVKASYFIANVLDAAECLDRKRSRYGDNPLDKEQVGRITLLVLDEQKLPAGKKLFRLGEKRELLLVHEDLVHLIQEEGCTGLRFIDMKDYGAEFRD